MLESTFNNVEGLQACIFIRIRLPQRCFPVNIAKFLRAHILKYICERLLRYSEIYTSNNQIYILAEKLILGFTKYFIICSALPTLAPLNYVFLLHFSHFFFCILFSTFFMKVPMFLKEFSRAELFQPYLVMNLTGLVQFGKKFELSFIFSFSTRIICTRVSP